MVGGQALSGENTMSHAGGGAQDPGDTLMAMCLAIAQTAALALGALALAQALAAGLVLGFAPRWPPPPLVLVPRIALSPRARPPDLSLLQVFRR